MCPRTPLIPTPRYCIPLFVCIFLFILFVLFAQLVPYQYHLPTPQKLRHRLRRSANGTALSTREAFPTMFPRLIHQTWKSASVSPPAETIRWREGCKAVNDDYDFIMYDDEELLAFATKNYPQYLPLFKALHGVYMADMARILVAYHFGGIYMDLDFYCHRPFHCLDSYIASLVKDAKNAAGGSAATKHVLAVSLEPKVHANIFRDKDRVVIQDFYMATPKHPFFKWILDDRMFKFAQDMSHPPKGPFSYSIEGMFVLILMLLYYSRRRLLARHMHKNKHITNALSHLPSPHHHPFLYVFLFTHVATSLLTFFFFFYFFFFFICPLLSFCGKKVDIDKYREVLATNKAAREAERAASSTKAAAAEGVAGDAGSAGGGARKRNNVYTGPGSGILVPSERKARTGDLEEQRRLERVLKQVPASSSSSSITTSRMLLDESGSSSSSNNTDSHSHSSSSSKNSRRALLDVATVEEGLIIELREDMLHSLVDSSNSRLKR